MCFQYFATAQYATSGTGSLRNEIWWFNWAGFTMANGASKTFTTADGLSVTITFSNVTTPPAPMIMNTWRGAVLHFLYDFTDPAIMPALYQSTAITKSTFTMQLTATRNGVPAPCTFIAADAEASTPLEITTLTTIGSAWQAVDFYRNSTQTSNPLTGCNTQTVAIADTYGNASAVGQNPVIATSSNTGALTVDVTMDHQAPGGMAVAFGIISPVDRGDLPASYGYAHHNITYSVNNGCNYNAPFPSLTPLQNLTIGVVAGDADATQSPDDNAIGVDEEGVNNFPVYDHSGSYSLPIVLKNTTGNDAWLTGWFDFNRNGMFDNGESVTATIPNNATSQTLTWSGLPTYLPQGTANGYAFRFRLSSDQVAVQSATGYAMDGEIEDYFIPAVDWCDVTIKTIEDTTICAGGTVPLTTTGQYTTDYSWDNNAFLTSVTVPSPVASPTVPSRYIITGSNPQGCSAKDTVFIAISAPQPVSINNDTTICRGTAVQLTASIPGVATYAWSPQTGLNSAVIADPVAQPAADETYKVKVVDAYGCISEDSVKIAYHPMPNFVVTPPNAEFCGEGTVQLAASGGDSYTWLASDNSILGTTASLSVLTTSTQTYRVAIQENTCNTMDTTLVPVVVNEIPVPVITKSNDIDCSTGQAILNVSGGTKYIWDVSPGITDLFLSNQVVTPTTTTTYPVTIINNKGCSVRDSITVLVDFAKAKGAYLLPSAFTPNNDGHNDCFGLKNWGMITSLQFQIFNRWGQKVFATTDPSHCWDGRFKGVLQPAGGYAYLIKAVTQCGSVNRSGMVMLIR